MAAIPNDFDPEIDEFFRVADHLLSSSPVIFDVC